MIDREKTISGLKEIADYFHECRGNASFGSKAEEHFWELQSAARDAVEMLMKQEARVLTTDELFYMEHQGVYIERRNSQLYATEPAIVLRTSVCEPSFGGTKYILMRENKLSESRWACDYNKDIRNGWRCWTSKPTEEQRKAVKWDAD